MPQRALATTVVGTVVAVLAPIPAAAAAGPTPSAADPLAQPASEPAPRYTHRLADSDALYLLLHGHNPVDRNPWGPEAFAKAAAVPRRYPAGIESDPDAWPSLLAASGEAAATPAVVAANTRARTGPPSASADGVRARLLTTSDHARGSARPSRAASEVIVALETEDGFHINANPSSLDFLLATQVRFDSVTPQPLRYAEAHTFSPSFGGTELDVYEHSAVIVASFAPEALAGRDVIEASITAQACTDSVCLPPSRLHVTIRD